MHSDHWLLYYAYDIPSMASGLVGRMEEGRGAFKVLTGKSTGKRPLGKLGLGGRTIIEYILNLYR